MSAKVHIRRVLSDRLNIGKTIDLNSNFFATLRYARDGARGGRALPSG